MSEALFVSLAYVGLNLAFLGIGWLLRDAGQRDGPLVHISLDKIDNSKTVHRNEMGELACAGDDEV